MHEASLVFVDALGGRVRGVPVGPLLLDLSLDDRGGRFRAGTLPVLELPGGQGLPVGLDRLLQRLLARCDLIVQRGRALLELAARSS